MGHTIIIAEAGVNHNGDLNNAFKLVDAAVAAGVDYVKFQTFKADKLVSINAKKADYQIENTQNNKESQLEMLKKLELSTNDHEQLIAYCKQKGINFLSTAFDLDSLQYLSDIGLQLLKVPSGEITNLPYLRKAAQLFDQVILSTGMATMSEIKAALDVFIDANISKSKISILHCNTEYPTPMKDVNLKAMLHIQSEFGTNVGYSDHSLGIEVPIAAVALGAVIIEKHFTLNKDMPGPDHIASLDPDELKSMVLAIRNIETAIGGQGLKEPTDSEVKNMNIVRKSIVAISKIKQGDILTENNIGVKRPGSGINPMKWDDVIGTRATMDFEEDDLIRF